MATPTVHTAFLYCTGLNSSNITRNSVLNQIFDTAKNAYCILSDQYTLFVVVQVQTKKRLEAQIKKKQNVGMFSQSYIFNF